MTGQVDFCFTFCSFITLPSLNANKHNQTARAVRASLCSHNILYFVKSSARTKVHVHTECELSHRESAFESMLVKI
jgi:hypothetical protein